MWYAVYIKRKVEYFELKYYNKLFKIVLFYSLRVHKDKFCIGLQDSGVNRVISPPIKSKYIEKIRIEIRMRVNKPMKIKKLTITYY